MKTRRIAVMGLFISISLVLHVFERSLPLPFIAPGVKLGLANIITLTGLMILSFKDIFIIVLLRIILASALGGGFSGFIYSLSGGLLSLFSMYLMKKIGKDNISVIGISVVGAMFHNIGQLLAASIIISNIRIFIYIPVLFLSGVVTGIFIGITTKYLIPFLNKQKLNY